MFTMKVIAGATLKGSKIQCLPSIPAIRQQKYCETEPCGRRHVLQTSESFATKS